MAITRDAENEAALRVLRSKLPTSGRTTLGELRYQGAKEAGALNPLEDEPVLKEWKYWKLIENRFPYDMIYSVHHMLIPKRIVSHREHLFISEDMELKKIINQLDDEGYYDSVLDNFKGRRSVHNVYHVHLIKWHENRNQFQL